MTLFVAQFGEHITVGKRVRSVTQHLRRAVLPYVDGLQLEHEVLAKFLDIGKDDVVDIGDHDARLLLTVHLLFEFDVIDGVAVCQFLVAENLVLDERNGLFAVERGHQHFPERNVDVVEHDADFLVLEILAEVAETVGDDGFEFFVAFFVGIVEIIAGHGDGIKAVHDDFTPRDGAFQNLDRIPAYVQNVHNSSLSTD